MRNLIVLASEDRLGDTGRKPGFRLEERGGPLIAWSPFAMTADLTR